MADTGYISYTEELLLVISGIILIRYLSTLKREECRDASLDDARQKVEELRSEIENMITIIMF